LLQYCINVILLRIKKNREEIIIHDKKD